MYRARLIHFSLKAQKKGGVGRGWSYSLKQTIAFPFVILGRHSSLALSLRENRAQWPFT